MVSISTRCVKSTHVSTYGIGTGIPCPVDVPDFGRTRKDGPTDPTEPQETDLTGGRMRKGRSLDDEERVPQVNFINVGVGVGHFGGTGGGVLLNLLSDESGCSLVDRIILLLEYGGKDNLILKDSLSLSCCKTEISWFWIVSRSTVRIVPTILWRNILHVNYVFCPNLTLL